MASVSSAHDADVVYARLEEGPSETLTEVVTLTGATLIQLAPVDVDANGVLTQVDLDSSLEAIRSGVWEDMPLTVERQRCVRSNEAATLEDGFVSLKAQFWCPVGHLRQDFKILRVLPTNYRVVLGSQVEGERGRRFAQGVFTSLEIPRPSGAATKERLLERTWRGVQSNVRLGTLVLLALCLWTARARRELVACAGLFLVGASAISMRSSSSAVSAVMMVVASALTFHSKGALAASVLGGTALAFQGQSLGLNDAWMWWVGVCVMVVAVGAVGMVLLGFLNRNARRRTAARFVLVGLVLFSAGMQSNGGLR
jgi:hypothetical protein